MDEQQLNDEEQVRLFDRLFPDRFAGANLMAEIAPKGWSASPLVACFHPSVEQVWREAVAVLRNLDSLVRKGAPPRPEPTLDEIRQTYAATPIDPEREACELVAACVWDIFSDNHDVVYADGRSVDLGSFRGTAGFIADYLNAKLGSNRQNSPRKAQRHGAAFAARATAAMEDSSSPTSVVNPLVAVPSC